MAPTARATALRQTAVLAERQHVVDEVVAPRDVVEHRGDVGGLLVEVGAGGRHACAPIERVADRFERGPGCGVALRSVNAGLEQRLRPDAEAAGNLVFATEIGAEHRRVVGVDRAADAGVDQGLASGCSSRSMPPTSGAQV